MAEFGEQLRKAREEKGMTQQSLAEMVYVTRQTVSRWEGGERYPDLVTVKKLAQVLGVNAGFLLSDDASQHIVERGPISDSPVATRAALVLYAGIVISYLISVVGVLLRIPSLTGTITEADAWLMGGNAAGELVCIAAFSAGFVWILRGCLSPRRAGAVMMAFFAAECMKGAALFTSEALETGRFFAALPVVLGGIGIAACHACFWKKHTAVAWYYILEAVSVLGIARAACAAITTAIFAPAYTSSDHALKAVLAGCIYALLCYQADALRKRRKLAAETTGGNTAKT